MLGHVLGADLEVRLQLRDLVGRGHVAGDQQIPQAGGVGLQAAAGRGQGGAGLGDRVAAETDALVGVEVRRVTHQALDAAHAAQGSADLDFAKADISVIIG